MKPWLIPSGLDRVSASPTAAGQPAAVLRKQGSELIQYSRKLLASLIHEFMIAIDVIFIEHIVQVVCECVDVQLHQRRKRQQPLQAAASHLQLILPCEGRGAGVGSTYAAI